MTVLRLQQLGGDNWGPVALRLETGECLGVSGPSGIGKTRLLRAIADLDPHQGEMLLDDQPASSWDGSQWRRQVGYLPAEPAWWAATAREHFSPASSQLNALQLDAALLDKPIERLSSGERQRLALLRLLSVSPKILLLDEPTANLDTENAARVESCIRSYLREQSAAAIWVSHDEGQLKRICSGRFYMSASGLTPVNNDQQTVAPA